MVVSSTEDVKPAPSLPPQIRSAPSKPSPLRNTVLGAVVPQGHGEQLADGQEVGRLPQQGSSSRREVPLHRPGQFDVNPVALLAHQPSDPDLDSYFNDEDNDAFLAVEDSAMQGMEFSDALGTSGGQSVIRNANLNSEISRGGSPPAPASVKFAKSACCAGSVQLTRSQALASDGQVSAPPSDKPLSTLRQVIRASTVSLATTTAAGVKRPADVPRGLERTTDDRGTLVSRTHKSPYLPHFRGTRIGPMQQQQQSLPNHGRRAPFSDLPLEESTDVKRVKR
ncbi:hypothetical protein EDB87DRAFT_484701 [Lactarius vividus]|nr:hypothetical protein EDB87DRAFT_484701 [Lactarius vividus]